MSLRCKITLHSQRGKVCKLWNLTIVYVSYLLLGIKQIFSGGVMVWENSIGRVSLEEGNVRVVNFPDEMLRWGIWQNYYKKFFLILHSLYQIFHSFLHCLSSIHHYKMSALTVVDMVAVYTVNCIFIHQRRRILKQYAFSNAKSKYLWLFHRSFQSFEGLLLKSFNNY